MPNVYGKIIYQKPKFLIFSALNTVISKYVSSHPIARQLCCAVENLNAAADSSGQGQLTLSGVILLLAKVLAKINC